MRMSSQKKARELGLTGWVRNEPDGTVTLIAQGKEEGLRELILFCYNGVKYARVDNIEETWLKYGQEFNDFNIKYH